MSADIRAEAVASILSSDPVEKAWRQWIGRGYVTDDAMRGMMHSAFRSGFATAGSCDRKPISGSQRRVIEAVVERVLAGERAIQVAEDYPDEYGYGPVLDNLERAIRSRDQRIRELTEAAQAVVYGVGRHVASGDMERLARLVP